MMLRRRFDQYNRLWLCKPQDSAHQAASKATYNASPAIPEALDILLHPNNDNANTRLAAKAKASLLHNTVQNHVHA